VQVLSAVLPTLGEQGLLDNFDLGSWVNHKKGDPLPVCEFQQRLKSAKACAPIPQP
jgi:hypothetical protein